MADNRPTPADACTRRIPATATPDPPPRRQYPRRSQGQHPACPLLGVPDFLPEMPDLLPGVPDLLPGVPDLLPGVPDLLLEMPGLAATATRRPPEVLDFLPSVSCLLPKVPDPLLARTCILPAEADLQLAAVRVDGGRNRVRSGGRCRR